MLRKILSISMIFLVLNLVWVAGGVSAGDITSTGMSQKDLVKYLTNIKTAIKNRCYGNAGLEVNGTTASLINIANAINFTVAGVFYTKSATSGISVTASAQAVSTYCKYLIGINASGTVTATKGDEVSTDTAVLPALASTKAPIGYIKIQTSATTAFTMGTTSLNAGGITATYVNLSVIDSGTEDVSLTGL
jgi:hypothetical protein